MAKRWNPGHYLFAAEDTSYTGMQESRRNLVRYDPNWAGYQNIYLWSNHESTAGNYNFSLILQDLDKAQADGKMLIIRLMDRRFNLGSFPYRPFPIPAYVRDSLNGTWGTFDEDGNPIKVYLKTWVPAVRERLFLFVEALLNTVKDHPAFQGLFTEETTMGGEGYRIFDQAGYTLAEEAAYWREFSERGSAAVGDGIFFMNMNYGYSSSATNPSRYDIMERFATIDRSGVGASDARITGDRNGGALGYPFNPWQWKGTTSLIAGIEFNTYTTDPARPTRTAKEYLDFGVDTLGLNFMGWMVRTDTSGVDFNIFDVIEEVTLQSGRINTAKPLAVTYYDSGTGGGGSGGGGVNLLVPSKVKWVPRLSGGDPSWSAYNITNTPVEKLRPRRRGNKLWM